MVKVAGMKTYSFAIFDPTWTHTFWPQKKEKIILLTKVKFLKIISFCYF